MHPVYSFAVNTILLLTLNYGFPAAVSLTTKPLIAATGSSLDTILYCSTDLKDSVALHFTPYEGDEKEIYHQYQISNDNKYKYKVNNFSTPNTTYYYVLGTNNVTEHHAGEYFCTENNGIGAKLYASYLTVVGESKLLHYYQPIYKLHHYFAMRMAADMIYLILVFVLNPAVRQFCLEFQLKFNTPCMKCQELINDK